VQARTAQSAPSPLEMLPDPALIVSAAGTVLSVNQHWLKYTGLTLEQTLAGPWTQVVHPTQVPKVDAARDQAVESGGALDLPVLLRSASGEYRWFLMRGQIAADQSQSDVRLTCVFTDVDDLFRAQVALLEETRSVKEQAQLVDMAHDAIVIRSMAGEIFYWNCGAELTYGVRRSDAIGKAMHALLRTQFSRPLPQIENHLLRHGRWEGTLVQHHQDGSRRYIASRWVLKRDEMGSPVRVLEINSDITERRQAELSLQFLADASVTLATLVDYQTVLKKIAHLAVPFLADWCIVYHETPDGKADRVAMLHADASKGPLLEEIRRRFPLHEHPLPPLIARVLQDGQAELAPEVSEHLLELITINDEHRELVRKLRCRSLLCLPLSVRDKVVGAIAFLTDESARRYTAADLAVAEDFAHRASVALENATLYAEAREADQRKDEFLATLAHELRNPLAPIRNAVELMRLRGTDDEELGWARDAIDRQTQHLTRLVDDLLDVSRITRGKVELRKHRVNLNSILNRAVETVRPLIDEQEHRLEVSLPDEIVELDADPTRLEQIFSNLLNNAAKYTEQGGRIWLTAELVAGEVTVRVKDTGIGMTAEFLPRVFDMFVQAEHHHGRAQGGLGIGLSLVHRLVKMHGGSIAAFSEGLGKGSEFVVTLPITAPVLDVAASLPNDAVQPGMRMNRQILVVDDNVDAAVSLAMLLRRLGQNVRIAHEGETALALFDERLPDLVFLDIGLPRVDGYEVARRMRSRVGSDSVILIALTGWGQLDDRRRSQEAGFDAHITKPVDQATLRKILAQATRQPR
jgi:PAS domain S-box-containing protein